MEKIGYTKDNKGATGKRAVPLAIVKEVTAIFGRMGGYFFLLLQTLITRLITLTNRIQNWNNSEYVTIAVAPLSVSQGATKRGVAPCGCKGEPPACRLSVAPLSE